MIDLRMIGSRVLVRPENQAEHQNPSGVIVVESHAPEVIGTVLSVGPDVDSVRPGDVVLFTAQAGMEVELGEPKTLMMTEDEILAVWDEDDEPV